MKLTTEKKDVLKQNVDKAYIKKAISYPAYRRLIDTFLQPEKSTAPKYSDSLMEYTRLNVVRMNRLDKTNEIIPELQDAIIQINTPQTWLVLTEGWCGDAAQIIPALHKIASLNENIALGFLLRDDNLELMDMYLTNGKSRSLPKLIVLDENNNELFNWGPRPVVLQELFFHLKDKGFADDAIKEEIHKWYAQDKTVTIQIELLGILNSLV
ncbi:MAG TPA: thioredoxin family protein [Chitinophagaceae bacterium]|nr:thioredoxin family protein [Chitinophagaceae bacterium]